MSGAAASVKAKLFQGFCPRTELPVPSVLFMLQGNKPDSSTPLFCRISCEHSSLSSLGFKRGGAGWDPLRRNVGRAELEMLPQAMPTAAQSVL